MTAEQKKRFEELKRRVESLEAWRKWQEARDGGIHFSESEVKELLDGTNKRHGPWPES